MSDQAIELTDVGEREPSDMLELWRGRIFSIIFASALVAAFIPYVLNIQIAMQSGQLLRAVIFSAAYVTAVVVTFWRAIPFTVRAWCGLSLFFLIGVVSLALYGPEASGRIWLFTFAVLTSLLLGLRAGIVALAINSATMLLWLAGSARDLFAWSQSSMWGLEQFLATTFSFLFLNAVVAISLGVFVRELEKGFKKERMLARDLRLSHDKLVSENAERRAAEEALRESEKKYRLLADNVEDQIWMMDISSRRMTYVSPSVERMRGYLPDEVLNQSLEEILTPESMQKAMATLGGELDGDADKDPGRSLTMELEEYRRDGSTIWTETTASFVRDRDGEPVAVLGITRDITERKRVERALREQEQALARSRKMESLGLMAGGIAHDLNNILSGIVGYPDLLLLDLPGDSPLRKPVQTIKKAGERAAAVVEDLLTVARGVASGRDIHNLNNVVDDYLQSAEHGRIQAEHPAVTFLTDLDPELLNTSCSETHIRKSLLNLVLNASEAIEDSGTVTISTENRYIDAPLNELQDVSAGEYVLLTVSDNGIGIDQEHFDRIFEPFYTKKMMGRSGTGLGLAVVWNTIQDHNGLVDVRSRPGGTSFELYFPATREAADVEMRLSEPGEFRGDGETVLVVDDEESQRTIACALLIRLGYRAKGVSSGEEAVSYLVENEVDLVLLDMIMPQGINGRETYEQITKVRPNQKAVIASGYAENEDVKAAQELGAGQYLRKPYTLSKLGAAVQQELRRPGS